MIAASKWHKQTITRHLRWIFNFKHKSNQRGLKHTVKSQCVTPPLSRTGQVSSLKCLKPLPASPLFAKFCLYSTELDQAESPLTIYNFFHPWSPLWSMSPALLHDVLQILWAIFRNRWLRSTCYLEDNSLPFPTMKGWLPRDDLQHQHSKGIYIRWFGKSHSTAFISLVNLRCHIPVGSFLTGRCLGVVNLTSNTKITEFQEVILEEQAILWFYVPV